MIIKKLVLHNFGVYASTSEFQFHGEKPIVLIGGLNGRGKTTFLEAILIGLYGSNSFAYQESSYRAYGDYLKSFINISDGTLNTWIDIEFLLDETEQTVYRVHRQWSGDIKKTKENIQVYKNDIIDHFLTENWIMFIEGVLPSGLANFFFFDGEKIAEIAVEDTNEHMKESIKSLLGITVVDSLEADLKRINYQTGKKSLNDKDVNEIERLKNEKESLQDSLTNIDNLINETEQKIVSLGKNIEISKQEYVAKGGDIVTQKQELYQERTNLRAKLENIQDDMITVSTTALPLIMVRDLLINLRKHAEREHDQMVSEIAGIKIKQLLKQFINRDNNELTSEELIGVAKFRNYVETVTGKDIVSTEFDLSDAALYQIQYLLDKGLVELQNETIELKKEYKKVTNKLSDVDNYLDVEIDEEAINKIFRSIKEYELEIARLETELNHLTEQRKVVHGKLLKISAEHKKIVDQYLKNAEDIDDRARLLKYSNIALDILRNYKVKLQRNKIDHVATTMTSCYKKLANKKNLIDRIIMDPETLDFFYQDKNGNLVSKQSLSAGEKQLMVISMLWALALCSERKLPVIIDTPLSRLDSAHRVALITTYFPNASDQTIILSTDTEIDKNYYELMKNDIGDEYTLVYDDVTKATSVKEGYLMGVKDDC